MLEFLSSNSFEMTSIILTVIITLITIPSTIIPILKSYKKASEKSTIELKDLERFTAEIKTAKNINNTVHAVIMQRKGTREELYEKRNFDKILKKISFALAIVTSILGTIILFAGVILSLCWDREINWITASSGAIFECVAGLYFWMVHKTTKEVNFNTRKLEKDEDFTTAVSLVEKIQNSEVKDDVYKNIILQLINDKNS